MSADPISSGFAGALSDPYTLMMVVIVGIEWAIVSAAAKGERAYKGVPLNVLGLTVIAVATVALGLNVGRLVRPPNTDFDVGRDPDPVSLQVNFYGPASRTQTVEVPFRVTSGQINVGCGETRQAQTTYNAPPNSRNITARSTWENVAAVGRLFQDTQIQGTVITGRGGIAGGERQWTGNCPGGGHGELVLTGSYVVDQISAGVDDITLSLFQKFVPRTTTISVPIPTPPSLPAKIVGVISASVDGGQSARLRLIIGIDSQGNIDTTPQVEAAGPTHSSPQITASIEGRALKIAVDSHS